MLFCLWDSPGKNTGVGCHFLLQKETSNKLNDKKNSTWYGYKLIWVEDIQFSHSVVSDSLQPRGLQHDSPPCPSPTSRAYSNSCPLSQWCRPSFSSSTILFFSCLESFSASGSFPESVLHIRWPNYWSFRFSISPSSDYSGLISFRKDWSDLLAVQGTLKNLLQHHSSKASTLRCSASFIVQLSCPYMITGKTIALTRRTFFGKVMSLLFNMLSRFIIAFLPKSKCLWISWLQSPSAVILEPIIILKSNAAVEPQRSLLPNPESGRVERHALTFSYENSKTTTHSWTTIYWRMLEDINTVIFKIMFLLNITW